METFRNQGYRVCDGNLRREFPASVELNETKQYLLCIARNILIKQKKNQLYPLELFTIAKTEQKYPDMELFQSVSELYDEKWIVPGESITKDKVFETLEHQRIYDFIKEFPGCDTLDIMKKLNISFNFALKNLETLFKFGFIRARVFSQYYLYYPIESPEELDLIYRFSRNKTTRAILKYVLEQGSPLTVLELSQALNKSSDAIQFKFKRLVQAGILSQIPNNPPQYQPNTYYKERAQEILKHLQAK